MDRTELALFAKLCSITYLDVDKAIIPFSQLGFKVIKFFNNQGAQGYLLNNGEYNVLSFRGTEGTRSDIIADIELETTKEYSATREYLGEVHRGFKKQLDAIWPDIIKTIEQNPGRLIITGHSLGAGIGTIAASRLQPETLVTFGSPRVGNRSFVNNLTVTHHRVQNNNDPVTSVPLPIHGYRHHGTHVYMDYTGKFAHYNFLKEYFSRLIRVITFKEMLIDYIKDHFLENYIKQLEKDY